MNIYFNEVKFSLFCIVFSQNGYRVGTAKELSSVLIKNVSAVPCTEHLYG